MKKGRLKKGTFAAMLILISVLLCSCMEVVWEKFTDTLPAVIIEASDGNYVYAGDAVAKLLASDGTELWNTRVPDCSYVSDIINGSDNSIIGVGSTDIEDNPTGKDLRIIKLNQNGEIVAEYDIPQEGTNSAKAIRETSDGGLVILANYLNIDIHEYYSYVIKTDANGNILWEIDFTEFLMSTIDISTDDYIIVGGAKDGNAFLIKLDQSGSEIWQKTYSAGGFLSVDATSDGGFVGAGYGSGDGLVVKVTSSGEEEWSKAYGDARSDDIREIHQTSDGGYVFAGKLLKPRSYLIQWSSEYWLVKLDASGEEQVSKILGDNGEEWALSVTETSDNGYIAAGYSQDPRGWINKFK